MYPTNFKDVTFEQFSKWQAFFIVNQDSSDARQAQAMLGLSDDETIEFAYNSKQNYFGSLFEGHDSYFKTTESFSIDLFGRIVEIEKGFDLFEINLGAAQTIQQIHDQKCVEVFDGERFKELSNEVNEIRFNELTDEQKLKLLEFNNYAIAEYYKIIPDLFAWAIVGIADYPTEDKYFNSAKAELFKLPAYKVQPVLDAFFLTAGYSEMFPPNTKIFQLLARLECCNKSKCSVISIRRLLIQRLGLIL